jgi:hypothetical protein
MYLGTVLNYLPFPPPIASTQHPLDHNEPQPMPLHKLLSANIPLFQVLQHNEVPGLCSIPSLHPLQYSNYQIKQK